MGDKITISLDERSVHGKKVAKLRKEGLTPVVVYGPGMDPIAAQAPSGVLDKVVAKAGKHTPVYAEVAGKKKVAMIKDVDVDPAKGTVRHVAFHAVRQNKPVEAEVPIRLDGEGESEAEKAGLIVLQTLEQVEVKALPKDLPDVILADIRGLKEAGEKLLLGDITLPEDIELVERDTGRREEGDEEEVERNSITNLVVASVWEPSALQAANDAAAGDAEDEADVEAENGGDTDQESQAEETKPGGKDQDEPKQENVDANK